MEPTKVGIGSNKYELRFPSLRQIKRVSTVLGVDPLKGGLKDLDWNKITDDEAKTVELLKTVLNADITDSILDEIGPEDVKMVVTAFFLKARMVNLTLENGLANLPDTINAQTLQAVDLLTGMALTSQSTTQAKETPK